MPEEVQGDILEGMTETINPRKIFLKQRVLGGIPKLNHVKIIYWSLKESTRNPNRFPKRVLGDIPDELMLGKLQEKSIKESQTIFHNKSVIS